MFNFIKNTFYIAALCSAFVACPVVGMCIGGSIAGGGSGALLGMVIGSMLTGGIGYYQANKMINEAHELQINTLREASRQLQQRLAVLEGVEQQVMQLEVAVAAARDNLAATIRANEVEQSKRESSEQLRKKTEEELTVAQRRYLTLFKQHSLAGSMLSDLKERVLSNNLDETELVAELDNIRPHLFTN